MLKAVYVMNATPSKIYVESEVPALYPRRPETLQIESGGTRLVYVIKADEN